MFSSRNDSRPTALSKIHFIISKKHQMPQIDQKTRILVPRLLFLANAAYLGLSGICKWYGFCSLSVSMHLPRTPLRFKRKHCFALPKLDAAGFTRLIKKTKQTQAVGDNRLTKKSRSYIVVSLIIYFP